MSGPPFLYLTAGPSDRPGILDRADLAARIGTLSIYDLRRADLGGTTALLVPMHADQIHLARCRDVVEGYLSGGGAIVFNGHVAHPFLPELRRFVPLDRPKLADLHVVPAAPHPAFAGLDHREISLRRGVAGFYGRGHNPMPAGAVAVNALASGRVPVDWVWRRPGGGLLFMHAGNDLWMYASDRSGAAEILPNLLDWLERGA
ncbi:MAG TPA: hypothetical protein VFO41_00730 [Alphaproteobacteria bacterium]|nr:hypothetical protein [Alphaproteobacteria bacterium]